MGYSYIEKRYNVMELASIGDFAGTYGRLNGNCKDVYFLRMIGVNMTFAKDIEHMDELLTERMQQGQGIYSRAGSFPKVIGADDVKVYTDCYDIWASGQKTLLHSKKLGKDSGVGEALSAACQKTLEMYRKSNPNRNDSIERNFAVKLLFWLDELAYDFLKDWDPNQAMKFVAQDIVKEQEYLFCYLLTLLGIDVLLLQSQADIDGKTEQLKLSEEIVLGEKQTVTLGMYDRQKYAAKSRVTGSDTANAREVRVETPTSNAQTPKVVIPRRENTRKNTARTGAVRTDAVRTDAVRRDTAPGPSASHSRELDFEELALRASSVVMIALHNNKGEVVGTGSGIMIGRDGYILTNNHVARGGTFYSVRIENDETIYKTDQMIKYNSLLDLAVIRIDRQLQPLPIYNGSKPLVRGQKVVAIGSPLGLFNSVSDGIIAGFRTIDDVDMIQFTAPISHGSSGGAILNMFGEVIGVSTAGFDDGQNINLAVGYEFINTFIMGFR